MRWAPRTTTVMLFAVSAFYLAILGYDFTRASFFANLLKHREEVGSDSFTRGELVFAGANGYKNRIERTVNR